MRPFNTPILFRYCINYAPTYGIHLAVGEEAFALPRESRTEVSARAHFFEAAPHPQSQRLGRNIAASFHISSNYHFETGVFIIEQHRAEY